MTNIIEKRNNEQTTNSCLKSLCPNDGTAMQVHEVSVDSSYRFRISPG